MRACQAGEGADRVRGAGIGRKLRRHRLKPAFVMAQTAHRFTAGNLLRQRRASALDCVFVRRINRLSQNNAAPGTEKATPAWTLPPLRLRAKSLPTRCPPTCRAT